MYLRDKEASWTFGTTPLYSEETSVEIPQDEIHRILMDVIFLTVCLICKLPLKMFTNRCTQVASWIPGKSFWWNGSFFMALCKKASKNWN